MFGTRALMRLPKIFKRKAKSLEAFTKDGFKFHWEDMPVTKPKRQYVSIKDLPPHNPLFCECVECTVKPKHYRKAFEGNDNE